MMLPMLSGVCGFSLIGSRHRSFSTVFYDFFGNLQLGLLCWVSVIFYSSDSGRVSELLVVKSVFYCAACICHVLLTLFDTAHVSKRLN